MNMLIIGNGFDKAHKRPTTYSDFLLFLELMIKVRNCDGNRTDIENYLDTEYSDLCPTVKEYLLSSFDSIQITENGDIRNKTDIIQELYSCLDTNVWYPYFRYIQVNDLARGKDWVDFESEIRTVIEFFDHHINDIYECLPTPKPIPSEPFPDGTIKVNRFWGFLDFSNFNLQNQRNKSYKNTYFDLIKKTYQDLENLIRCLEIYLDDCVCRMPIAYYSLDIQELTIDSVLSFNYTAIPTDIYPSLDNVHYIHGYAKASRPAENNNMVLGVNEYWDDYEKDSRTNFNCYKKFVQRIIKETGIGYKMTLKTMSSEYEYSDHLHTKSTDYFNRRYNNVYIFGHSLDVTDGDILREVIRTKGVVTTVFYRNKQQQSNQIANLSKVLGQEELLERVFSTSPTIIFKQQAEMIPR